MTRRQASGGARKPSRRGNIWLSLDRDEVRALLHCIRLADLRDGQPHVTELQGILRKLADEVLP